MFAGPVNASETMFFSNRRRESAGGLFLRNRDFEIVSFTGSITQKEGNLYHHIHMSAADGNNNVVGGHLNKATVSATCEMFIHVIDGEVNRKFSDEIGLNLFEF